MSTLAWILVPVVLFMAVVALLLAVRERPGETRGTTDRRRPWWGNPLVWLGVASAFAVVGLVIAPRLFGFTFLFLPFIWVGGRRRPRQR